MPNLVFNTGPVIALTAAVDTLDFLQLWTMSKTQIREYALVEE